MSLNGLDAVGVTQAYQAALAEAGGWFLLKYSSRDTLEILTRGTGGAGEARDALAKYEEKSPLYGLLLYRRRKVLLKYVPEGTSRLLQARVAVHFLTVTERFAPHDIVLPITTPEDLSDATLASACTLHTAAPSSSSSSGSSRQQKLSWIQEAAEEGSQLNGDDNGTTVRSSTIPTILEPIAGNEEEPVPRLSVASQAETVPLMLEEQVVEAPLVPEITRSTVDTVTEGPATPESDLNELRATLKSYDKLFEGGPEPRNSSQTARPDYNELYEHYYAQYSKPKVKLGPRPRPSLDGKRPSTAGGTSQDTARPVSSLPSGLRSASRKAAEKKESKTKTSSAVPTIAIPPPPPIPMTPELPPTPVSPAYSTRTPASVKSMPVSTYSSHHRSTGMTQERTRLMRALELRKKQQKAREERQLKAAEDAAAGTSADAEPEQQPQTNNLKEQATESSATPAAANELSTPVLKEQEQHEAHESDRLDDPSTSSMRNSGLVFTSDRTEADDMTSTASISSPISAQTQGSSGAPSTRPSSISEDETAATEDKISSDALSESAVSDLQDEEQSIDSTTTLQAGNKTPVPPSEIESHSDDRRTITADQLPTFNHSVDFEESISQGPASLDNGGDARSRRRSKRESVMYVPSGDPFVYEEAQTKRRNRESVIMPPSKRQSWYESKDKRRVALDPLQVSAENSETEYLSDDSFMEELQTATVHQAKPMSVSKSPITPFFPRRASTIDHNLHTPPGTAQQAYQALTRLSPDQNSLPGRVSAGAWPPRGQQEVVVAKRVNVSSGISQRIKALAEKSSRERSVSPINPASTLDAHSHTLAQRKSSFFAATPVETSPNSRPATRLGSPSFLTGTTSTTPEKKPAGPIKSTVYNVQRETEKPESVQVTARIIRDERSQQPMLAMPTETTPLDLHQSPLIIDHRKPTYTPKSPTRGRQEPTSPRTLSSSHSREQSIAPSRNSSESTWRAFGRRMSESKSIHSPEEEKKEEKKDKKESRTSKMFKRMSSSMSSMPWKNSTSNLTLPEHSMTTTSLSSVREPPPSVHLGDLNIQFPDTLLWKRRWAEIDSMGNIVLSPSKSNEKGVIKRYHLSEFRTPYPPDQDRQELPNSVVLDFVDGRTLQCACETYTAQAQVLQVLREAHDAWLAYSQTS